MLIQTEAWTMTITPKMLDELLEGCERPEDLLGDGGLMKELKRALMQRMLGAELTEHLGYEHGAEAPPIQPNRRNGVSRKTVKGEGGAFEIAVPRDRDGSFEPRLIPKGQSRIDGIDGQDHRHVRARHERARHPRPSRGALRAGGLARPDQPRHGRRSGRGEGMALARARCRLPGGDLRRPAGEDPRQGQPDGPAASHRGAIGPSPMASAVYLALGITGDGQREVLGLWIADTEGAKFWLSVMTELRNRGVQDVLIAVVDGLKGFS